MAKMVDSSIGGVFMGSFYTPVIRACGRGRGRGVGGGLHQDSVLVRWPAGVLDGIAPIEGQTAPNQLPLIHRDSVSVQRSPGFILPGALRTRRRSWSLRPDCRTRYDRAPSGSHCQLQGKTAQGPAALLILSRRWLLDVRCSMFDVRFIESINRPAELSRGGWADRISTNHLPATSTTPSCRLECRPR